MEVYRDYFPSSKKRGEDSALCDWPGCQRPKASVEQGKRGKPPRYCLVDDHNGYSAQKERAEKRAEKRAEERAEEKARAEKRLWDVPRRALLDERYHGTRRSNMDDDAAETGRAWLNLRDSDTNLGDMGYWAGQL